MMRRGGVTVKGRLADAPGLPWIGGRLRCRAAAISAFMIPDPGICLGTSRRCGGRSINAGDDVGMWDDEDTFF
jgi:hypothetical protein